MKHIGVMLLLALSSTAAFAQSSETPMQASPTASGSGEGAAVRPVALQTRSAAPVDSADAVVHPGDVEDQYNGVVFYERLRRSDVRSPK